MSPDQPVVTVRRNFPRPPESAYAALRGVPTGVVCDAQGRRGGIDHRIRPLGPSTAFVGPALTVRTRPADSIATLAALEAARPGDVMIIATGAHEGAAVIGGHFAALVHGRGLAALVTDGMARDAHELEALAMPVFARGLTPSSSYKHGPGEVGLPIAIGEMVIEPGDVLVGDADGIVVVRQSALADTIAGARTILDREARTADSVADGALPDWLAAHLAEARIRYLD